MNVFLGRNYPVDEGLLNDKFGVFPCNSYGFCMGASWWLAIPKTATTLHLSELSSSPKRRASIFVCVWNRVTHAVDNALVTTLVRAFVKLAHCSHLDTMAFIEIRLVRLPSQHLSFCYKSILRPHSISFLVLLRSQQYESLSNFAFGLFEPGGGKNTLSLISKRERSFIAQNYFCCFMCSLRKSWAGPSLPQSLTTTDEHRTTLRSLPSASSLQRPAYFPSCMLSGTVNSGIWCCSQRPRINLV